MNVSRKSVEFGDAESGAFQSTHFDRFVQSWTIRRFLSGFDLGELRNYHAAFLSNEARDGVALRIQPEAALALLVCADAEIVNPLLSRFRFCNERWFIHGQTH